MDTSLPTFVEAEKLNLTSAEFDRIKEILDRNPNALELEIFSHLWSEHASYKNSLKWLKQLPRTGDHVLVQAGKESAGAIDVGNGMACVFKVESHNHPCAIQPRLGASTGLRVVTRDLTSMGAKPVALLSSLRMGDGRRDTAKWLFEEVTEGLTQFEKQFGVPVVGGEIAFSKGYNSAPVVNNMAIGVSRTEDLVSGVAKGVGNFILILGAASGTDGVDVDIFDPEMIAEIETKTVALDVMMDVSVEKHLQRAIQKLVENKLVVGMQAIVNQGIIGAAAAMTARADSGVLLELEKVPQRDAEMTAREILLSQTWGRLLVCIEPGKLLAIEKVANELDLSVGVIGQVTEGDQVTCRFNGHPVVSIPSNYVGLGGKAPMYEPAYDEKGQEHPGINLNMYNEPDHYPDVVKVMIGNLNVASKKWLTDKFDRIFNKEANNHKYPSDSAFIDLEGSEKSLVATMDCNSAYMKSNPFIGVQIAIAEAARNIVCAGGIPMAISDCLNFGNPQDKEVYTAFVQSIKGISKACNDFNTPVVSGNVSFYNQRSEEGQLKAIIPTPVIGMVGVVEDKKHHTTLSFRHKGDMIFLIGQSQNDVNSSEYATSILSIEYSAPPHYKVQEELDVQDAVSEIIRKGLVRSVHDVSNGGLFFTLLECAIPLEFGFDITSDAEVRKEAFLFGESQSRVVVSVSPEKQDDFVDLMMEKEVPFSILGHVTKGEVRIDDESYGFIAELKKTFENRLKRWVEGK